VFAAASVDQTMHRSWDLSIKSLGVVRTKAAIARSLLPARP
jgi:hypothetical protein